MSIKKLLVFTFLLGIGSAAYCADFSSFMANEELNKEIESRINAAAEQGSYKYNYSPMVFKVTTTYKRDLFIEDYDADGAPYRISLNYKQDGLWGEGAGFYEGHCYGTLINKDYLLTHEKCLRVDRMEYIGDDAPGALVEFTPLSVELELNGRSLEFDARKISKVFIDYKSGAALIKISNLCLQEKGTTADNVCVRLWEWAVSSDKVTFGVKDNYGTVILSNIDPKDNVEESFLKRVFFSPVGGEQTISSVKDGFITVNGKARRSYFGEPLFHRASSDKNILVGIKTVSDDQIITYTKTNKYALFSSEFTKLMQENVETKGIKLTKDLNGNTSL